MEADDREGITTMHFWLPAFTSGAVSRPLHLHPLQIPGIHFWLRAFMAISFISRSGKSWPPANILEPSRSRVPKEARSHGS